MGIPCIVGSVVGVYLQENGPEVPEEGTWACLCHMPIVGDYHCWVRDDSELPALVLFLIRISQRTANSITLTLHRILSLPDPVMDNLDPSSTHNDLTRSMQHLSKILTDSWKRWKSEYLLELHDMHCHFKPVKGVNSGISVSDVIVVYDENLLRGFWTLGTVEELMVGADGIVQRSRPRHEIVTPSQSRGLFNGSINWNYAVRRV